MTKPIVDLNDQVSTWRSKTNTISNNVGDPDNLITLSSTDLVSAANELVNRADSAEAIVTANQVHVDKVAALTASVSEINTLTGLTSSTAELNLLTGATISTAELNILDGVTATAAEINKLDGFTGSVTDLNKLASVTATSSELNTLDGITSTTAELNKLDGFTGSVTDLNVITGTAAAGVTPTKLGYVSDVTSNIQSQINSLSSSKMNTSGGTFTGNVTFNDSKVLRLGTNADAEFFNSGAHTYLDINYGQNFYIRDGNSSNATRFTFDADNGNFTASGDVTAFSDKRLKSNITTIDNALNKVLSMRGVYYDKDGVRKLGVISQEVDAVFPEVVKKPDEPEGYQSVAYGNLVGALIEAIKEQNEQIVDLQNKLKELMEK